jgi:NAD(P)-dependent dehydrogenase (short-subunit alcohol dehydrogenase family)/acyl carrier protein
VHVVLNSLAGEFIPASLGVTRRGGRFVEIGKTGIWSPEQVKALGRDIRYSVVFLGSLRQAGAEPLASMLKDLAARLEDGRLVAPPVRVFPLTEASAAFRFMAQARHIGKIVLRHEGSRSAVAVRPDATYLVTGGLGGLGLQAAASLVESGARSLVLVGRSGASAEARARVSGLEASGARVAVVQADVGSASDMEGVTAALLGLPTLRGIVHAAGALADAVIADLDEAHWDVVLAPKVSGTANLGRLAEGRGLDFFVCFSAGAAVLGSPGQGNYAAANAVMDALVADRHARGLPGLAIHWGAWAEVGMAARLDARDQRRWEAKGMGFIPPQDGGRVLLELLSWPRPEVAVLPARWDVYAGNVPEGARRLLAELVHAPVPQPTAASAGPKSLTETLAGVPPARRRAALLHKLHDHAARALGLDASTQIADERSLKDLGLDSLMAVELRNAVAASVGKPLPATLMFDYPTLGDLADFLLAKVLPEARPSPPAQPAKEASVSGPAAPIDHLSDAEAEALLLAELDAGGKDGRRE